MTTFLTDGLIIANPALSSIPKFKDVANKAIYIVEHSEKGAVGVSVNQNFSMSFSEISSKLLPLKALNPENLVSQKIISGGPLQNNTPWILGRNLTSFDKQFLNTSLSLNFSEEAFKHNQAKHFSVCGIGSFGWGAGQLENELANYMWHYFPTNIDTLSCIPFSESFAGGIQLLHEMKSA